jgi:MFS family permease
MLAMPISGAYVANLAPPNMRGRYMGINTFSWSLALVIGPALGISAFQISPVLLWIGCAVFGVVGALIIRIKPATREL